jgi:hypothetical protein
MPQYVYDPCAMTIGGALITMIFFGSTSQSIEASENLYGQVSDWATNAHGQMLASLARAEYNAQSAQKWMSLLQQWKAETAGK